MEEEKKEIKDWCEETIKQVEKEIENISNENISTNNIDYLYRLVDIHKDLKNEIYWKEKIDMYRESGNYGNYGNYGEYNDSYGRRGVPGSGRGRYREGGYNEGGYNEGGSYGRRGVKGTGRGRYRGEEMMDEMYMNYGEYSEGRDNYGADQSTLQSLDKMLESVKKFMKHLEQEATSQEEVKMIKETAKEISMM